MTLAAHPRHGSLDRYREIIEVLVRHGFGYLVDELGLGYLVPFHRGLLGHRRRATPYTQAEHLRLAFEELGTTFIKLGQILSTRSDLLPPDFVTELAKLQDAVPPESTEVIETQIIQELGQSPSELFAQFDPEPLGSASIGQVHAATLQTGEEVVVKVQRPGVEARVEEDLAILLDLAHLAQSRTIWGKIYDLPGMVEEFGFTLREELDYLREGRNAERIAHNLADDPMLHVPQIYWRYTTRRVLTMERIRGIKISDLPALDAAGIDRRKLAETDLRIVLKMILEDGFFHADPHPGNFLIESGGVIGLLDYGMVGQLDEQTRDTLVVLFLAIVDHDVERVIDHLETLGIVGPTTEPARLKRDVDHLLTRYWGVSIEQVDVRQVLEDFLNLARQYHFQIPANLTLMDKTLIVHEGLARALDPALNLATLLPPYARELTWRRYQPQQWARRLTPTALDLSQLLLTLPRRLDRLLGRAERGTLELEMRVEETEHVLAALNRMVNRLILGILTSGLIIGIALLLQIVHTAGFHWLIAVLLWISLGAITGFAVWLIVATVRGHG